MSMQSVRSDLVDANHILAHLGVVDGFGHVSARDPDDPDRFLISRSMAPALVADDDILSLDLSGDPQPAEQRRSYLERFIHAEIYRARADVGAVVHSHSPAMIPFGVTSSPLAPIYHMAAGMGANIPVFEISDHAGDATDLLVRTPALGADLARSLGGETIVLMRGHGSTVVGATIREAVFIAVYAESNARLQSTAMQMGPIRSLSEGEITAAAGTNAGQIDRAWELWVRAAALAKGG